MPNENMNLPNDGSNNAPSNQEPTPPSEPAPPSESPKTFTQEEVNRMMAREKNEGKKSVLRELGVEDIDSAKNSLAEYAKVLDAQKTDLQKANEAKEALNKQLIESQQDKAAMEAKYNLLLEGCNKDSIEEALVLVMSKVNDETDFAAAVAQVKEKVPSLFSDSGTKQPQLGTGNSLKHNRQPNGAEQSLGSRLAANSKNSRPKTNPYFSK